MDFRGHSGGAAAFIHVEPAFPAYTQNVVYLVCGHLRFAEALPSEPLSHLLWRRVVVKGEGGVCRARDDEGFVHIRLSIRQSLEQLIIYQRD